MKTGSKRYQKCPALVLGLSVNGLSVVRSLGRKGIRVIAMDRSRQSEFECSRYIEKFEALSPDIKEDEFLQRLLELGRSEASPVFLIPTNDFYVLFAAKHSAKLARYFTFMMASYEVMETVVNKQKLYTAAEQLGVLCPKTYSPRSEEELLNILDEVPFPCFLKPAYGHIWRKQYKNVKLLKIENKDELLTKFREVHALGLEVMVQEIIPGGDETIHSVVAFMGNDSEVLAAVTKQKIRQYPVGIGDGCFQITTRNADLKALGIQLLRGLRYAGPATVEFRWDAGRKKFVLIEINARTISAQELIFSAGLNFPYLSYRVSNSETVNPEPDGRAGVKWICFEWDFFSFLQGRQMKILSTAGWLKSLWGINSFAFFCWDDPLPFLVRTFKFITRGVTAKIGRMARSLRNGVSNIGSQSVDSSVALSRPQVSVLMITRNRRREIGETLEKLYPEIDFAKHEVVVVDSSEGDETRGVIQNYPWVRYYKIKLPLGTRPQSYSYGCKVARGEIVALLDDDAHVEPGWLSALESCFEDPRVGAAGGRVLSMRQRSSITEYHPGIQIGRVLPSGSILSNLHLDSRVRLEVDTVRGCNMSARKNLLEQIGYFDPRIKSPNMRVEDDVCMGIKRLGYKIIYEPKAAVLHLAAKRPDALRTVNLKNEFNTNHNTVWFYLKHFRFHPKMLLQVALFEPMRKGMRRIVGGSLRKPRFSLGDFRYLLPAAAGLLGAWWGALASVYYIFQDEFRKSAGRQNIPKLSLGSLKPNKVVETVQDKLNVLILDGGLPETDYSGKTVLVSNLIRELSKHHCLHYVYFPKPGESVQIPHFIHRYAGSVTVMPLCYRVFRPGQFFTALTLKPWFFAKWKYREDWKKVRQSLKTICREKNIDVIDSFSYQKTQYALGLGYPILHSHNDSKTVILRRQKEMAASWNQRLSLSLAELRMWRYENWMLRQCPASIILSSADAEIYPISNRLGNVHVIPNGVDTAYFTPRLNSREAEVPTLLFTGHMSYKPNRDAALTLCREILPRVQKKIPNAKVVIAGADPTDEVKSLHDGISIVVTGKVEDLRPYFEEAWVYACPMRLGAGIKNKLLEAMAMKKAIVATHYAAAGISVTSGEELILADDWDSSAEAIVELLRSSSERLTLGNRARERVERDYQWQAIGEKRSELLRMISRNGHTEAVFK